MNDENDIREIKRCRLLMQEDEKVKIPTLYPDPKTGIISYQEFRSAFKEYQAVFVPNIACFHADKTKKNISTWQDIVKLFQTLLPAQDQESWCLETTTSNNINHTDTRESFFQSSTTNPTTNERRDYCSFLVQHDKEVVQTTLQNLPFSDFIFDEDAKQQIHYGPCLWFFFGWNYQLKSNTDNDTTINHLEEKDSSLQGRPEHTDSVSHDATWHYQFSGTKIWKLRPTMELLQNARSSTASSNIHGGLQSWPLQLTNKDDTSHNSNTIEQTSSNGGIPITIACTKGDLLIINTRLWWHQTWIPLVNHVEPSISYARDARFSCDDDNNNSNETMVFSTNLDGLFATEDIEQDTIIFTEKDMPNCELHRSTSPNCQIAQLEDGTDCVVSMKPISAGEFFSVDFSSSDEEEEEEEDDEEEDATSITSTTSEK